MLGWSQARDVVGGRGRDVTIWYQSQSLPGSVPTRTSGPKGDCEIPHRPGE